MLRKLSLVAVAAASLGVAALAPTSASAWGGWLVAGTADGIGGWAGAVRASSSAARPIMATAMATAAAMCGDWSRPRGDPAGAWSTAAIDLKSSDPDVKKPRPRRAGAFCLDSDANRRQLSCNFTKTACNPSPTGNNFRRRDLVGVIIEWISGAELVMNSRIDRRQRTDRSQDQPIDLRCRGRTAAAGPSPGIFASFVPPPASDGRIAQTATTRPTA